MAGIYLFCFLVFPLSIIFPNRRRLGRKDVFLEKRDENIIKGMASLFVIISHLILGIQRETEGLNAVISAFIILGQVGVLIFFFISGYGMYKGYGQKKPKLNFWYKRLFHMYLPCVIIQFIFWLIKMLQVEQFHFQRILFESFFYAWFIDVILIQYLIFYLSWLLSKGKQNILILFSFLFNIIPAFIFYVLKFEARWYNALWFFPIGMLVAWKEEKLIDFIYRKWARCIVVFSSLLLIMGGGRTCSVWFGKAAYTDVLKVMAGVFLCLLICTFFLKLDFTSRIMEYMGRRSLFFYLIHLGIMEILDGMKSLNSIEIFYIVLLLSFPVVEVAFQLYQLFVKNRNG